MDKIRNFLESSTIHGLSYISTTKRFVRVFWVIVVILGFTGAGVMIYQSFQDWDESPVKTTVETFPITELTFPKVTVCPPKNTYTDLNYDLMMTENMTLKNETRNEMTDYAMLLLYEHCFDNIITNLSLLQDKDRYYNWYHGITEIMIPYYTSNAYFDRLSYSVSTHATSGTITTKDFGDMFDADKVEKRIYYRIEVVPADNIRSDPNISLHFEIERITMTDLSTGKDDFYLPWEASWDIPADQNIVKYETQPKDNSYTLVLSRSVTEEELAKQKLSFMPGFNFTWYFSGIEVDKNLNYTNKYIGLDVHRKRIIRFNLKK